MFNFAFSVQDLEYFLLILMRVASFVYAAPFFGTKNVPFRLKAGLSVFISFLVYQVVVPHPVLEYSTAAGYAALVLKEAICGLSIGFASNVSLNILQFAGAMIDMDVGLSMMSFFDPLTRNTMGFSGTLYQYSLMLILIITDLHHYILRAFIDAFRSIPIGSVSINTDTAAQVMISYMSESFKIAFQIFLPLFSAMLLLNAVLGILAKVAPQMNMFAVGVQIKILTGLSILLMTAYLLPEIAELIFNEMQSMTVRMIEVFSQ